MDGSDRAERCCNEPASVQSDRAECGSELSTRRSCIAVTCEANAGSSEVRSHAGFGRRRQVEERDGGGGRDGGKGVGGAAVLGARESWLAAFISKSGLRLKTLSRSGAPCSRLCSSAAEQELELCPAAASALQAGVPTAKLRLARPCRKRSANRSNHSDPGNLRLPSSLGSY